MTKQTLEDRVQEILEQTKDMTEEKWDLRGSYFYDPLIQCERMSVLLNGEEKNPHFELIREMPSIINLLREQQAEINRLKEQLGKPEQLKLRPMEELKALIEEQESGYHDGSMFYAVFNSGIQVIVALDSDKLCVGFFSYDLQDLKGWLPLDTLPTTLDDPHIDVGIIAEPTEK